MALLDFLFKKQKMPDVWLNTEKRTLLWVARRMRWYRRMGGRTTPEQDVLRRLERIRQADPSNWTEEDEKMMFGGENEEAMFQNALRRKARADQIRMAAKDELDRRDEL